VGKVFIFLEQFSLSFQPELLLKCKFVASFVYTLPPYIIQINFYVLSFSNAFAALWPFLLHFEFIFWLLTAMSAFHYLLWNNNIPFLFIILFIFYAGTFVVLAAA